MSRQSENARLGTTLPSAVGCEGKVSFDNFKLANDVVKRPRKNDRCARTAYRCGHCRLWHIGSNKGHSHKKESADRRRHRDGE